MPTTARASAGSRAVPADDEIFGFRRWAMAVPMSLSQNVVRDGVPHDNGRLFREVVLITEDAE